MLGSGDSQLPVLRWLTNSVVVTVAVTAGRVFFDSLAGYALSRLHFRGCGAVFALVLATIEEAARLDGASVFRTFWSVILPMARPALITLTILSFQGSWNEFSHFLVVTGSPEHKTLVTGLADLTAGGLGSGTQFPLKMATALITTIPVAVLFFVFQRHLVRGANGGAVKG